MLALDRPPSGEPTAFAARMGRLRDAVLGAGKPGATRLPGARDVAHAAQLGDALELDDELVRMLKGLAAEVGAEPLVST